MRRILAYIGGGVILCLAVYGAVSLVLGRLDGSFGRKAADVVRPVVRDAASAAGEQLKKTIKETPDEQLEKESEDISRKLYPIAKGALKGHLEAILKDANRGEVPKQMYQAGKDVSEKVVIPFGEGLAEGSSKAVESLDKSLQEVRKFQENNKDLLNSIAQGLESVRKGIRENPILLPPPPLPPFPRTPPPLQAAPQNQGQAPLFPEATK
jgi:hypothetical protein